jgi:hypothetical protein
MMSHHLVTTFGSWVIVFTLYSELDIIIWMSFRLLRRRCNGSLTPNFTMVKWNCSVINKLIFYTKVASWSIAVYLIWIVPQPPWKLGEKTLRGY